MDTHTIYRMFTLENTLLILTSVRETRTPLLDSHDDKLTYPLSFLTNSHRLAFIVQNARGVTNFRRYLGSGSGSGSHRAVSRLVAGYRIALHRE